MRYPFIKVALVSMAAALSTPVSGASTHSPLAAGAAATLAQVVAKGPAATGVHEKNMLRFDVAEKIANAFFACARRKDKARSIHIVDQFGNTIYAARMDGQIADNIDVARMKAMSALYFRDNTGVWLNRSKDDPLMALWLAQLGQFTSPVGLPIVVQGQLLGAVGVGGASGDCAHEALTVVLGPQPPLLPPAESQ
jgi:glc operon protein GlcG